MCKPLEFYYVNYSFTQRMLMFCLRGEYLYCNLEPVLSKNKRDVQLKEVIYLFELHLIFKSTLHIFIILFRIIKEI